MATAPKSSPYSFSSFIDFANNNFVVILLVGLFFIGGFATGAVWKENQLLKSGGIRGGLGNNAADLGQEPTAPTGPTADQLAQVPPVSDDDHIQGNENAKITLIEYSDFECPFCARFHPTMEDVVAKYEGEVAWVYRHYPLNFHPQAMPAAQASECVAEQLGNDAFWTFADEIFAINTAKGTITETDIQAAVEATGANWASVSSCIDSGKYEQLVEDQMAAGSAAGVSGTPGTILVTQDGQYEFISGALPTAQVEQVIEKYL